MKLLLKTPRNISMSKTKILITEDEFIVSKNLENKLSHLGYDIIGVATSGEEALEKIRENVPDLILMDIMLAGKMDGIETANIIKNKYNIPLIFLSAYSSQEIYRRAQITEPYAYIIKPFEERELEINISIALYKHKAEKEIELKQRKLETLNENLDKLVQDRTSDLLIRNAALQKEIKDRKNAEENESRLSRVIEQAEDHIIITDVDGIIEYVNPRTLNFLGYTENEMYGKILSILKPNDRPKFVYNQMWETIKNGKTYKGDFTNVKKNGEKYYKEAIIVPLRNSENVITHFASIGRDVTENLKNEQKMTSLIESEKERISKDLHDGLGQTLTAIRFSVGSIIKSAIPKQKEALEDIKQLIDQSTKEVREVSYNLMPSVLGDYGLKAAIKKLISYVSQNATIKILFSYDSKLKRLNKEIEIGVYRIIQESLNNIQKYAQCSQIKITIEIKEKNMYLAIIDNGVGFDTQKFVAGQGIHNMKNRTKLLEGYFSIKSIKKKGTSVAVIIPIRYE